MLFPEHGFFFFFFSFRRKHYTDLPLTLYVICLQMLLSLCFLLQNIYICGLNLEQIDIKNIYIEDFKKMRKRHDHGGCWSLLSEYETRHCCLIISNE
jgi:hypothetical protein